MIVFSATNEVTGDVFVGNTREGLEVEWAQLISQADEGASGKFFASIRRHGPDSFEVEEYAYADSGAELRELTREARQELNAEAIKSARRSSTSVVGKQSMSMEAIMASIEEAAREAEAGMAKPGSTDSTVSTSGTGTEARSATKSAVASVATPITAPGSRATEPAGTSRPSLTAAHSQSRAVVAEEKLSTGRTGSNQKEKRIREAIAAEREEREQLRQTQSRESQAEMNAVIARIEQRRNANKATNKKAPAKKAGSKKAASTSSASGVTTGSTTSASSNRNSSTNSKSAKSVSAAGKLAVGRTGSSVKEKRIKEAIAQEKAEREAQQRSKAAAEADEMAAILARLDARTKDAAKIKRRR